MSALRVRARAAAVLASALAVAGCPSDPENPRILWLALDGSELQVQLIDHEPPPF